MQKRIWILFFILLLFQIYLSHMSSFTSHPCQTLRLLIKRRKWTVVAFNNWLLLLLLQINSTEILSKQPQFSEIFYSSLDWSRPKIVAPTRKKGLLLLLLFKTKKKLLLLQNSGLQKWIMLLPEFPQFTNFTAGKSLLVLQRWISALAVRNLGGLLTKCW